MTNNIVSRVIRVCGLALPLVLVGCSMASSTPSEADARAYFEKQAERAMGKGVYQIDTLTKTNGLKQNQNGVDLYVLEFKSTGSYPKGVLPQCVDHSNYNAQCFQAELNGARPKPVGAKDSNEGSVIFEKTEKGWRPARFELR